MTTESTSDPRIEEARAKTLALREELREAEGVYRQLVTAIGTEKFEAAGVVLGYRFGLERHWYPYTEFEVGDTYRPIGSELKVFCHPLTSKGKRHQGKRAEVFTLTEIIEQGKRL